MGHPVVNKGGKGVTLRQITFSSYKKLIALAATISSKMGAASAFYAAPTPDLTDLDTAAATLQVSASVLGHKRNRASKAQLLQAQSDANVVRYLLQQLLTYATNTCYDAFPADPYAFSAAAASSGFSIRLPKKVKHISQARWVKQTTTTEFPAAMMRLTWRRGLGLIKGAPIAGYLIKSATDERTVETAGYQDVSFIPGFLPTDSTGLPNDATAYQFAIAIDGGLPTAISLTGADAQTFGDLTTFIETALPAGCHLQPLSTLTPNSEIRFVSDSVGTGSAIRITPSHLVGLYLFQSMTVTSITNCQGTLAPVDGGTVTIPSTFATIATTTRTNYIHNPSMKPVDNLTGQIVPFNSLGEGNPINFTLRYIM